MKAYDEVSAKTRLMEDAIYGALGAIDEYRTTIDLLLQGQEALAQPNEMLLKRLRQFARRAEAMTRIIEDDVLTELLFCIDRLFSVELAERGEFI